MNDAKEHNMAGRLDGKVALITGSDSGIGQATAEAFATEGADVVVSYLVDAQGADRTRAAIEDAGRSALVVECDVSDETQVEAMFDQVVQPGSTA
jgi:glucose 1-dehydrogenase